jgi:hypothetical protein
VSEGSGNDLPELQVTQEVATLFIVSVLKTPRKKRKQNNGAPCAIIRTPSLAYSGRSIVAKL